MSAVAAVSDVRNPAPTDRGDLRLILTGELSKILKMDFDQIDLSRSLDDYGLDSIDAIIAAGAVSDRIGLELPPEILIQHRSFNAIEDAIWKLYRPSQAAEPTQAPVFLFAGSAGRDGFLWRLADACSGAATFEAITLGTWREWIGDNFSFEDIIERACAQVLASRRPGEVRLAGYSQGGQLAYAVAERLTAQGHRVDALYIFDYPAKPLTRQSIHGSVVRWGVRSTRAVMARGRHQPSDPAAAPEAVQPSRKVEGRTRARLTAKLVASLPPTLAKKAMEHVSRSPDPRLSDRNSVRIDNVLHAQYFAVLWKQWWEARDADTPPLAVESWLFRSQDEGPDDLGWREHLDAIRVIPVPGTHVTMFSRTNLPTLSDAFKTVLRAT